MNDAEEIAVTKHTGEKVGMSFWIGLACGAPLLAFGLQGLLRQERTNEALSAMKWIIGLGIFHDGIYAPLLVGAGWLTAKLFPITVRIPIRVGLILSVFITAFAWPYVRGYGKLRDNATVLPLKYSRNLVWTLAILWIVIVMICIIRIVKSKRKPQ